MKQNQFKPCALCGQGMAHANQVYFYRLSIEQMILNYAAIRRQHGLETMLGHAAAIGQVLGPDEDLAEGTGAHDLLICADCAMKPIPPMMLIEAAAEKEAIG